jgi:hypothetical protein
VFQFVFWQGVALCLAMWVCLDARTSKRTPCYDFGTFIFFTWYVSVPIYLLVTHGWRGAIVVLSSLATVLLTAVIVAIAVNQLTGVFI